MPTRELPDKFLVAFSFAGEQRELVRTIAEAVEKELGFSNVFFDEWFEHYLAGHDADLKLQQIYGEQTELVVVCVSKPYGAKPWTQLEHEAIRARVMKARSTADERDKLRILPIRVGDGKVKGIFFNTIVPDVRARPVVGAVKLIIDRLGLIRPDLVKEAPAPLDWSEHPPQLHWPVADHGEVRAAFERLLTREAPWQFLPLCGPSESGKTHIIRQMLENALFMPDLACGHFDFKGTTDMDAELRAFVQYLDVPLPPAGPRLNERLGSILDAVNKRRGQPALLIFDTYEAAGEAEKWVERELLPSLIRSSGLRVVIAGRRVPKTAGVIREANACPLITLKTPPPDDWFEFGKQYDPSLTLAFVKQACQCVGSTPALLAQLLSPQT